MDCNACKDKRMADVPYIVHEADMARMERTIKRLWISLLVVIVLFVGSNIAWTVYENQFEDVSVNQEVDTENGNAYVAGVGDVNYGESEANSEDSPS